MYDSEKRIRHIVGHSSFGILDVLWIAAENAAIYARRGAFAAELEDAVSKAPVDVSIPVLLKLNLSEDVVDKAQLSSADFDTLRKQQEQLKTRAADTFQQVLVAGAKTAGTRDIHADGPFVHAQLTPAALRAVAWDTLISYIGLDREDGAYDSGPTIPASLPQSCTDSVLNTGARGAGVRIAMIDLAGVPSLSSNCFRIAAQQTPGGGTNQHVDFMMGLIGNRYGTGSCSSVNTWEGYGYESSILLANDASYSSAYSWARNYSAGGVVGAKSCR